VDEFNTRSTVNQSMNASSDSSQVLPYISDHSPVLALTTLKQRRTITTARRPYKPYKTTSVTSDGLTASKETMSTCVLPYALGDLSDVVNDVR
jgi:hypothetical protein